jgi:ribonuclease VapC
MILDSSAISTILFRQPMAPRLVEAIANAKAVGVGAPTVVECSLVISARLGVERRHLVVDFLRQAEVEVLPFRDEHYAAAIEAFQRYGKGKHIAALNFGDCMAYAMAQVADQPLLFTGTDFSKTDIRSALRS